MADPATAVETPPVVKETSPAQQAPGLSAADLALRDPTFYKLPKAEQLKALQTLDPQGFGAMSGDQQEAAIGKLGELRASPGFFERLMESTVKDPAFLAATGASLAAGPAGLGTAGTIAAVGGAAGAARTAQRLIQGRGLGPALAEGGVEGLTAASGEAGGRAVVSGLAKAAGPVAGAFTRAVTPEAERALTFLEPYAAKATNSVIGKILRLKRPTLLAGEATESGVIDAIQNIAEGSFFGGPKIQAFKRVEQPALFERALDDVLTKFGERADPQQVAAAFRASVSGQLDATDVLVGPIYRTVEGLAKDVKVSTAALKDFARPYADSAVAKTGIEAENTGHNLARDILKLPDQISFEEARDLRSALLTSRRTFDVQNKAAAARKIGVAKRLTKLADGAVEDALRQQAPDALPLWRDANRTLRTEQKRLNNAVIRRLVRISDPALAGVPGAGKPEELARSLFTRNNVTAIRKVRDALGDASPEFQRLQRLYIDDTVARATGPDGLSGQRLNELLIGKSGLGMDALREAVPDAGSRGSLLEFANALRVAQARPGSTTGRMFIQLAQFGALVGALGGGVAAATGAVAPENRRVVIGAPLMVLLGPEVLSRMLTNEFTSKLLIKAVRMSPGARSAAGLVGRIAQEAGSIELQMKRERQPPTPEAVRTTPPGGAFVD